MRLVVSDTGIGIPKDKQGRVFERFYRAEESRNKSTGGSGLGLAICKHIVEKHKGTLLIESEEGEGTTVTVILPRMSDMDVSKEQAEALTAQQEAADAESGKLAQQEAEEDRQELLQLEKETEEAKADKAHHHKEKKLKKDKKGKKKADRNKHGKVDDPAAKEEKKKK